MTISNGTDSFSFDDSTYQLDAIDHETSIPYAVRIDVVRWMMGAIPQSIKSRVVGGVKWAWHW